MSVLSSISTNGGAPVSIGPGVLPAISQDGIKLAFANQPQLKPGCIPSQANFAGDYKLVVRTLIAGTEQILPLPPEVAQGGLPSPISHLSWASDSVNLAVSTSAAADNEGWALYLVNTSIARYYVIPGPGVTAVSVTGPDAPGGALIHQVAIGFVHEEHISLAADRTGHWLLYLADHDLWVSRDGRIPSQLATGLIAASWM